MLKCFSVSAHSAFGFFPPSWWKVSNHTAASGSRVARGGGEDGLYVVDAWMKGTKTWEWDTNWASAVKTASVKTSRSFTAAVWTAPPDGRPIRAALVSPDQSKSSPRSLLAHKVFVVLTLSRDAVHHRDSRDASSEEQRQTWRVNASAHPAQTPDSCLLLTDGRESVQTDVSVSNNHLKLIMRSQQVEPDVTWSHDLIQTGINRPIRHRKLLEL